MNNRCQRCMQETNCTTMSYFNTQMICMDCDSKERNHTRYQEAKKAELEACKRGNMNFPGIGKPADL